MKSLFTLGLACLLLCGACANKASNDKVSKDTHPDWILGSWHKTFDPDNDPEEIMTFQKDGSFLGSVVGTTDSVRGTYEVSETAHTVSLRALENGRESPMGELTFDETRNKLYYAGKSGGPPAYYERVK
jgi:hypothetical protein